ncbi:MAG: hypothetical protein ABIV43_00295 [Candidatus Saccharimonadales bacterium]
MKSAETVFVPHSTARPTSDFGHNFSLTPILDNTPEAIVDRELSQDFDDYMGCASMLAHLEAVRARRLDELRQAPALPQPVSQPARPVQMINLGQGVWVERTRSSVSRLEFTLGMQTEPPVEPWGERDDQSLLQHYVELEEVTNLV